jgi:hypothetical protein
MGKSLSRKMYMYRRNCLLVLVENFPIPHVVVMLTAAMMKEVLLPFGRYTLGVVSGKERQALPDSVSDYLKAALFLLKNSGAIVKKRVLVNRFRKHPRNYLLKVNKELALDLTG